MTKLDALPETLVNAFREATQPPTNPAPPASGAAGQSGSPGAGQGGGGAAGRKGPTKLAQWWFGS